MSKITKFMGLILSCFISFNIICMESLESGILTIDKELLISTFIQEGVRRSWNNIFDFYNTNNDKEFDKFICILRGTCKEFNELFKDLYDDPYNIELIEKYKEEQFQALFNLLKNESEKEYKSACDDELNKKSLTVELEGILKSYLLTKDELIKGIKLIMVGADVNLKSPIYKDTLLFKCCEHNDNTSLVRILILLGTDVNLSRSAGITALMRASQNGAIDIVKLLINARADVNACNMASKDALMYVCDSNAVDSYVVAKLLIDSGIDLCHRDSSGRFARDIAVINRRMIIVNLIDKALRKINKEDVI